MPEDPTTPAASSDLQDRRVLVALTGGIACYKTATVVSRLVQRGASVRVIMTESATRFITPLTLQSLSGQPVLTSIWDRDDRPDSQHIGLARWAEAILIAPLSANTLAKLAHGLCDDLVSLVVCARPTGTPLIVAPAMNADMWANPIVQRNLKTLLELPHIHQIGPETGWQACRTAGAGRMTDADHLVDDVAAILLA